MLVYVVGLYAREAVLTCKIAIFPLGIMPILFPFGKNEELEAAE